MLIKVIDMNCSDGKCRLPNRGESMNLDVNVSVKLDVDVNKLGDSPQFAAAVKNAVEDTVRNALNVPLVAPIGIAGIKMSVNRVSVR